MITKVEPKLKKSKAHVSEVSWEYILEGKRRKLRNCVIRLGVGTDESKISWTRRLDCRGKYKNGHVDEYIEDEDLPQTEEGELVFCQFLFEPEVVIDDKTGKIVENCERETGASEIIVLQAQSTFAGDPVG